MTERKTYLPNEQSFRSGLPEGKSLLATQSSKGRTKREREKQAKRAARVRERSIKVAEAMSSGSKKG